MRLVAGGGGCDVMCCDGGWNGLGWDRVERNGTDAYLG